MAIQQELSQLRRRTARMVIQPTLSELRRRTARMAIQQELSQLQIPSGTALPAGNSELTED